MWIFDDNNRICIKEINFRRGLVRTPFIVTQIWFIILHDRECMSDKYSIRSKIIYNCYIDSLKMDYGVLVSIGPTEIHRSIRKITDCIKSHNRITFVPFILKSNRTGGLKMKTINIFVERLVVLACISMLERLALGHNLLLF